MMKNLPRRLLALSVCLLLLLSACTSGEKAPDSTLEGETPLSTIIRD